MTNMIGTIFHDRYQILDILGSGGTSVVYKAKDTILNRLVTIKILREQLDTDSKFLNRFRNEAQAVAKLSHPNIVSIYDVTFSGGLHYLVMEYVEGQSLKEYLDKNAPLPVDEALNIFQQLLQALQHAHENNVIHRDIKPHNILLDTKHNVHVTDFGLAVNAGDLAMDNKGSDIMGSIYYMSPEQIKGESVTVATDIYAAGVLLYEMLCGRRPFNGETAVEIARQHLKGSCIPPHKINPAVSTELSSLIMKAMRRDKDLRFADAEQMLAELKAVQNKNRRVVIKPQTLDLTPGVNQENPSKPDEERTIVIKRHVSMPEPANTKMQFFRDKKPTPLFFISLFAVLLVLTLLGSMASIMSTLTGNNEEITVENYVGKPLIEAQQMLTEAGLKSTVNYAYSAEYAKDVVMRQNISAGQKVKEGRFIDLTVSQGSQTFKMPSVTDMTLSQAKVILSKYDVTIESTEVVDDAVPAGQIISQLPVEGEDVSAGAVVTITVSKGKEIAVPQLIGRTEEDAMVYLVIQGFNLGQVTHEESTQYDAGYVIHQSLTAGDMAMEGSQIDLTVSSGPGPASKTARLTYTLPSGNDNEYNMVIEVTDDSGTHKDYTAVHRGGETVVRDINIIGSGTIKVYLDGDAVYSQDVS